MARPPWTAIAFAGAAVAALGAVALASRRQKTLPPARRVALIGDSYAVGLGPELAKLLPDFRFEGHEGTRTDQWARHTKECGECGDWLTAYNPDVVLVSLGVNDGATPNIENYKRIVQGLYKIGARVVWIEPPAAIKTQSRNVIASVGVRSVPGTTTPLASDGIHPRSYGPWARDVAQAVTDG